MPRRYALALLAVTAATPAKAVDYRWVVGTGQGTVEASIRNRAGGRFIIFCASGREVQSAGIIVEGPASQGPKGQPVDVQVVIDGKSFAFSVTDGYGPVAARGARFALENMARALLASKAGTFAVEYPGLDRSETFALQSVRDALSEGRGTIVTPCL